ncbi:E3 ubiquitin-protein ligase rnf152-like [Oncorhynchus tshawytscha]|uniref:RING-type domain-containing protein n=1 Tax=Oncorhynchus tshawytscha TaxID=74940 RepID=A0AAZ3S1S2_ONCTS|nr:E3 ubiquitin-protein ligase rnf152-like [Oncorhynchus tshawytscha]
MAEAPSVAGTKGIGAQVYEDVSLYEEYECKICYNYFDLDRRTPKILECLHTFCEECLNTLHLREDRGWRIGCPLCRHRTPVPEYRIHNLPNNTKVTDAYPFYIQDDSLPQDILPPYPPPLHPALTAAYRREVANEAAVAAQDQAIPSVAVVGGNAAANSYDSVGYESCQNCRRIVLTTGCVCAIFGFVSMLVLLFLGLIFVHNFNNPPSPVGPICLSVASIMAMFSVVMTWLVCWLRYRPDPEPGRAASSNASRRHVNVL